MAGRVQGKVAFITGAARGQGRSHAVRLAEEGADIIAVDLCGPLETAAMYPPATEEDLAETVRQVEALGRRIIASRTDVRDREEMQTVVDAAVTQLGRLDIVVANAGIQQLAKALELTDEAWQEMLDVNLTGVWNTCRVALPHLVERGGGAIVIISSAAGLTGVAHDVHYSAAKHGVVGLMQALANEFGRRNIRVNTVHPTGVVTLMIHNEATYRVFNPHDPEPTREQFEQAYRRLHPLGIPYIEPVDVSNAVLFLASDEARYITGVSFPVDAGFAIR